LTRAKSGRISFLDVLSAVPHFFEGLLAIYAHHDLLFSSQDNGTFPLFMEEWNAEEEMLLLDAVEQHGHGNWLEILKLN
jgi:hypothetical protein